MAAALDAAFFEFIEKNKNKILDHQQLIKSDPTLLSEIVHKAVWLKVKVLFLFKNNNKCMKLKQIRNDIINFNI